MSVADWSQGRFQCQSE